MNKIKKILIANRGEIVSRIIRTCKEMDIETVSIFSDADKNASYLKETNQSFYIGNSSPQESYLNMDKIIEIAKENEIDAIHPGYGFLSENIDFAKKCVENNIIFIGSSPQIIENTGSKILARNLVKSIDVNVITGFSDDNQDIETFIKEAEKITFPILIKADLGGGGRGIKIVNSSEEMKEAFLSAKRESLKSFGQDKVFIEKYFKNSRHIEFQIVGDSFGNILVLGERECSLQRKFQKIIEESPAPNLSIELKDKMFKDTIKIAKSLKYNGIGTIEFILDDNKNFYFMEINPRLQVEHPVTEMLTGLDIVKLQIIIAAGNKLNLNQEDIKINGHAIECRICAENTNDNFIPSTGNIIDFNFPENTKVRIENGINKSDKIDIFYDSLLTKIICYNKNRQSTITTLKNYLKSTYIMGLNTNTDLIVNILENSIFREGQYNTEFLKAFQTHKNNHIEIFLISAILYSFINRKSEKKLLKNISSGWRNNLYQYQNESFKFGDDIYKLEYNLLENNSFEIIINGSSDNSYIVELLENDSEVINFICNNQYYSFKVKSDKESVFIYNSNFGSKIIKKSPRFIKKSNHKIEGEYKSHLPGEIVKIHIVKGQEVKKGDSLITISSMKMENTIYAHSNGIVEDIFIIEKSFIQSDILLLKLKNIIFD